MGKENSLLVSGFYTLQKHIVEGETEYVKKEVECGAADSLVVG